MQKKEEGEFSQIRGKLWFYNIPSRISHDEQLFDLYYSKPIC